MEIDLYKDLTAFNALTADEQEAEAKRLQAVFSKANASMAVAAEPAPEPEALPQPPAPAIAAPVAFVDSPGSVILRAEDILPDDEPEPERTQASERWPVETSGRKVKMDDQLKSSGPLFDIAVPSASTNGTLVVCPTCGSQSEGEDLFCITCGSFLNEEDVGLEVEAGPACVDCGASIEPGEIFCPSCGSALPG